MMPPEKGEALLKIAKALVTIAGFGIAFLGLLAGILSFVVPVIRGGESDLLKATISASLIALGVGLGLPLAWQGLNSLLGRPSRPFRPWPIPSLAAIFILAAVWGQAILSFDLLPPLAFPPFHILATALPPLMILAFVGRRLSQAGVRWRDVILHLSSGAFLAALGAFGLEGVSALLLSLVVFAAVALTPGGEAWLQELVANLSDPAWLQDPQNLRQLLLSPAVLAILTSLLTVIAPLIEEFLKPIGVAIMGYRRPSRAQAFLWGLAGGAGFALVEGLLNGTIALEGWGAMVAMRVGAAAMHCLGSGLMALGWHHLFIARRPWHLLAAYAASVGLHGLWNAAAGGIVVASLLTTSTASEWAIGGLALLLLTFLVLLALLAGLAILYLTNMLQADISPTSSED